MFVYPKVLNFDIIETSGNRAIQYSVSDKRKLRGVFNAAAEAYEQRFLLKAGETNAPEKSADLYYNSRYATNLPIGARGVLLTADYLDIIMSSVVEGSLVKDWIAGLETTSIQSVGIFGEGSKITFKEWKKEFLPAIEVLARLVSDFSEEAKRRKIAKGAYVADLLLSLEFLNDDKKFAAALLQALKDDVSVKVTCFGIRPHDFYQQGGDKVNMDEGVLWGCAINSTKYTYRPTRSYSGFDLMVDVSTAFNIYKAWKFESLDILYRRKLLEQYDITNPENVTLKGGFVQIPRSWFQDLSRIAIDGALNMLTETREFLQQADELLKRLPEFPKYAYVLESSKSNVQLDPIFKIWAKSDFTLEADLRDVEYDVSYALSAYKTTLVEFINFVKDRLHVVDGYVLPSLAARATLIDGRPGVYHYIFSDPVRESFGVFVKGNPCSGTPNFRMVNEIFISSGGQGVCADPYLRTRYQKVAKNHEFWGEDRVSAQLRESLVQQFFAVRCERLAINKWEFHINNKAIEILPPKKAVRGVDWYIGSNLRANDSMFYQPKVLDLSKVDKVSMLSLYFAIKWTDGLGENDLKAIYESRARAIDDACLEVFASGRLTKTVSKFTKVENVVNNIAVRQYQTAATVPTKEVTPNLVVALRLGGAVELSRFLTNIVRVVKYGVDERTPVTGFKTNRKEIARYIQFDFPFAKKSVPEAVANAYKDGEVIYKSIDFRGATTQPRLVLTKKDFGPLMPDCWTGTLRCDLLTDVKFDGIKVMTDRSELLASGTNKIILEVDTGVPGADKAVAADNEKYGVFDRNGKMVKDDDLFEVAPTEEIGTGDSDFVTFYINDTIAKCFFGLIEEGEAMSALGDIADWCKENFNVDNDTKLSTLTNFEATELTLGDLQSLKVEEIFEGLNGKLTPRTRFLPVLSRYDVVQRLTWAHSLVQRAPCRSLSVSLAMPTVPDDVVNDFGTLTSVVEFLGKVELAKRLDLI